MDFFNPQWSSHVKDLSINPHLLNTIYCLFEGVSFKSGPFFRLHSACWNEPVLEISEQRKTKPGLGYRGDSLPSGNGRGVIRGSYNHYWFPPTISKCYCKGPHNFILSIWALTFTSFLLQINSSVLEPGAFAKSCQS